MEKIQFLNPVFVSVNQDCEVEFQKAIDLGQVHNVILKINKNYFGVLCSRNTKGESQGKKNKTKLNFMKLFHIYY